MELQGHGHTADTSRPMTIEVLAGDVVALLDHLGVDQADLFGFSLGGLVACVVALGAPARFVKLIVASAGAGRHAAAAVLLGALTQAKHAAAWRWCTAQRDGAADHRPA